jgi:hypothetical protein
MSKQMIGKVFFGSLAAFVSSLLITAAAVFLAIDRDVFIMNGPDVVGVRSSTGVWATLALGVLALILLLASAVGGFVSWMGALAATASRTDKSWFVALLVLGLLSVGFLATLIYLVAGPPDEPEPASPTVVDAANRRPTPVAH